MKKLALIWGIGVVLFASCSQKGPESVVEKFYTHLCKMEYDKVQAVVLPEHHHYYGFMAAVAEHISVEEMQKMAKREVKVSNIQCVISDDTLAVCSCLVTVDGQTTKNEGLPLKKVGKAWLVDKGHEYQSFMDEEIPAVEPDEEDAIADEPDDDIIVIE
jgi:hypothetical protein